MTMATERTRPAGDAKAKTKKRDPNTLEVRAKTPEERGKAVARAVTSPSVTGSLAMQGFLQKAQTEVDLMALVDSTREQIKRAQEGDLSRAEAMLISQAHTLDVMFSELARRAALNMGEHLNAMEAYLRVALKAQSQCRATLETLAEMKNPQPTAFIRQQNIGVNQQVNNGAPAPDSRNNTRAGAHGRAEETNQQNELLTAEVQHGETLDKGRTGTAGKANSHVEAVGAIHRS